MSIVAHVNDAADALGDLVDIHQLLDALNSCAVVIDPRALTIVVDGHRERLRAALAAVEKARVALGCPPDIGVLDRV